MHGKDYKSLLAICLLILSINKVTAKDHTDTLKATPYIQVSVYTGYLYAHHTSMLYLINNYARGGQIRVGWRFNGAADWEKAFRYPSAGIGYTLSDFGSKNIIGYGHALYGYLDIPIIERKRFSWTYNLGAGLAYVTKKFDMIANPNNEVIGSHINAFLLITTGFEYKPESRTKIGVDLGLNHYSNGSIKQPNWGLNSLFAMVGVKQFLNQPRPQDKPADTPKTTDNHWESLISIGAGFKERAPINGDTHPVGDLHYTIRRKIWTTNSWGIGLDLLYDGSIQKALQYTTGQFYVVSDSIYNPSRLKNISPACHANWSMHFGKISFDIQIGVYIYDALKRKIFNRWILELELTRQISLMTSLKSHFGSSDYVLVGVIWKPKKLNFKLF